MLEKLKRLILCADMTEEEFLSIKSDIIESDRSTLAVFSFLTMVIMLTLMVITRFVTSLAPYRMLYAYSCLGVALVALFSLSFSKKHPAIVLLLMYLYGAIVMGFGIVLGSVITPNEITAAFIAVLLTMPQVFVDRPIRMIGLIVASIVVFIIMAVTLKAPSTWSSDITNCIVFGVISCVGCTYNMRSKAQRFLLEKTIRYMAETDQLTGLKNRNSYEQRLHATSVLEAGSVYCVYVDVNGLHELNNSQGHEAGDRMLQFIATAMQQLFGVEDTFRIGGDEYVALGLDRSEAELRDLIAKLRQTVEDAGYHAAIGMGHRVRHGLAVDELVKEAEARMNEDKNAYYSRTGIDRRRARV